MVKESRDPPRGARNINLYFNQHHSSAPGLCVFCYSVILSPFTLLLVHLILHTSPHHSHRLCSHHLSFPQPLTPDLKTHLYHKSFPP